MPQDGEKPALSQEYYEIIGAAIVSDHARERARTAIVALRDSVATAREKLTVAAGVGRDDAS
jgi:hypothetical protein